MSVVKDSIKSVFSFVMMLISYAFRVFPIKDNKIFVSNFDGKGYGDNPKYICEKLLEDDLEYEIVWEVGNLEEILPDKIRKVKRASLRALFEAVTSRVWIDNYRKNTWFRKRKNQLYIQTWHAGIGFKKAENAAVDSLDVRYIKRAKNDSKMADLFLSGSEWETDKYSKYYWYNGAILGTGVPKQDLLVNINEETKKRLKNEMGIDDDFKVVLYAPTFRKNMTDLSVYCVDWERLLNTLTRKFGGKWIGAIRLHPGLDIDTTPMLEKGVVDLSKYSDAQEVLAVTDVLITDYSSIIFDFALTKKPAFLYAADYDNYKNDRDVFFDLYSLPFPFAETERDLEKNIKNFDELNFCKELELFLNEECGIYPYGNASKQVSLIIKNYIKRKKTIYDASILVRKAIS